MMLGVIMPAPLMVLVMMMLGVVMPVPLMVVMMMLGVVMPLPLMVMMLGVVLMTVEEAMSVVVWVVVVIAARVVGTAVEKTENGAWWMMVRLQKIGENYFSEKEDYIGKKSV